MPPTELLLQLSERGFPVDHHFLQFLYGETIVG